MNMFDGRKIRDQILEELGEMISRMDKKPTMAVFLIGSDPVSVNYVNLKRKFAENIGINFKLLKYESTANQNDVLEEIIKLGGDSSINGIMIQIPLPDGWNRDALIRAIDPKKDIDGLRYCLGTESGFIPPVVMAIDEALDQGKVNLNQKNTLIVGRGFLVGDPLYRYLREKHDRVKKLVVVGKPSDNLTQITQKMDVIISATGQASLIKAEMVKDGVVLIDAGTSETGGKLVGDIDPTSYEKASYYTPVPGGIGPMTIAMLLKNLVA